MEAADRHVRIGLAWHGGRDSRDVMLRIGNDDFGY
jgi:hypothetical protein